MLPKFSMIDLRKLDRDFSKKRVIDIHGSECSHFFMWNFILTLETILCIFLD